MKKLLLLTAIVILALSFTVPAFAQEAKTTDFIFWSKEPYTENETTKIIDHVVYRLCNKGGETHYDVYDWFDTQKAAKTVEEINIVPEIDGIKVTSVQCLSKYREEFQYNKRSYYENHNYSVKKITIPDTITYIGAGYFSVFEAVEELVVPASVETYSFKNMESLKSVTFLGDIEALGGFGECTKLENVNICGAVKRIGYEAFEYCEALKYFDIPETVTDISYAAFYSSGLRKVTIPADIDYSYAYPTYIFAYCDKLRVVTFSGESTEYLRIPRAMFFNCTALETVNFPEYCKTLDVERSAFKGCRSLETFTFPKKTDVTILYDEVFLDCPYLESVVFPENCNELTIGKWAFRLCTSLKTVTLPKTAKKITVSAKAFRGRTTLTTVKNSQNITKICGGAFRGCTALKSFTVSDKVTMIGENAFYGCKNLKTFNVKGKSEAPKIYSGAFAKTNSALKFTVTNNAVTKSWKTALSNSGLKNAKITVT